jgi:hypothetical protein
MDCHLQKGPRCRHDCASHRNLPDVRPVKRVAAISVGEHFLAAREIPASEFADDERVRPHLHRFEVFDERVMPAPEVIDPASQGCSIAGATTVDQNSQLSG